MKKNLIYSLLAFAIFLGGVSCKKKEKEVTPQQKLEGKWKITARTAQETTGGPAVDDWTNEPACEKDDILEFKSNNILISDEGSLKCDPDAPQQTTGSYNLTSDGKNLTLTLNNIPLIFEVLELSNTTLKVKIFFLSTVTITFTKI